MSNFAISTYPRWKIHKKDNCFFHPQTLKVEKNLNLQVIFIPAGDQPTAINNLKDGLITGQKNQVLLGCNWIW